MEAKIIIPKHGHVTPRADGTKARCGGPALCNTCRMEKLAVASSSAPSMGFDMVNTSPFADEERRYFVSLDRKEPNGYPWLSPEWDAQQRSAWERVTSMKRAGYELVSGADCFDPKTARFTLRWIKARPSPRADGTPKPHMRKIGGWWFCHLKGTHEACALDAEKAHWLWHKRNDIAFP